MKALFIVLLLVAMPVVSAASIRDEVGVVEWRQHVYSVDELADWNGDVVSVTLTRPHNFGVVDSEVLVAMTMNVILSGSNGARTFNTAIDGVDLDFCAQIAGSPGTVTPRGNIGGVQGCPPTSGGVNQLVIGEEQNWTFSNSGTGTVDGVYASVYVYVQDTVVLDAATPFEQLTNLTALEFLLFFAIILLALWLWGRQDLGVRIFGATIAALDFTLVLGFFVASRGQAWPLFMTLGTAFLSLTIWMFYALIKDYVQGRGGTA